MDDDWQKLLLNVLAYLVVAAAGIFAAAIVYLTALRDGRRLLPVPRLRRGRWGGREVVIVMVSHPLVVHGVVLMLASFIAFHHLAQGNKEVEDVKIDWVRLAILGSPVMIALTLAIVVSLLFALSRTRPHHIGVTPARWRANVILGVLTFLASAPVTLGVYFAVTLVVGAEEHPFERVLKEGFAWWEWTCLIFMTVVGAPLVEETIFRGVLQGWLRRAGLLGHGVLMATVLVIGSIPLVSYLLPGLFGKPPDDAVNAYGPPLFSALIVGGYGTWLGVIGLRSRRELANAAIAFSSAEPDWDREHVFATDDARLGDAPHGDVEHAVHAGMPPAVVPSVARPGVAYPSPTDWAKARLAIFGSAMLFALAHGWPNSLPLFLLGLGLGWLVLRTQSLIGAMVCHALFNAIACLVLYWSVASGGQ